MDLRDFIEKCEREGELKRIKARVDWHLELSHVAKKNEEAGGGYALLFENVKDYKIPVFTSAFTKVKRMAIAMGQPLHSSLHDLSRAWVDLVKNPVKPKVVKSGPVMENVVTGEKVNLFEFPAPFFNVLDGGRFIGTAVYLVTKDPETGWVNLGTYRMQLHDESKCGVQIIKGKHADMMLQKYKSKGQKMPAAAVIGGDPLLFLVGSCMVPHQVDEYDVAGALRGEPIEIIESDLTGLPIPAAAEIVFEGEIDPDNLIKEGPFGEYTGYYSGTPSPKVFLNVKRVMYRNNPIFWATAVGRPPNDVVMIQALNRTASLWGELLDMKIPGIKAVYIPVASCGRYWAIVSVKQQYPGHSVQVGTAVITSNTGNYGLKGVIVVDEDIDVENWDQVLWALSVRYDPKRSTEIISRGRATPLDPSLPVGAREITSRIILDACLPFEWKEVPTPVNLDKAMLERVEKRWRELFPE
jgi:4-hydroxy-3-polyprenylbenzoate decarboxylase